jgi:hypothetical protein
MKNRARIVSGLVALAAFFLAPLAEASLPRTSAPATEASAPAIVSPDPEPPAFSLFAGPELTAAAAPTGRAPSFLPLAAVSLLDERLQTELAARLEPSYPKTRYRVFEFLGAPILGVERGVSLELDWGCASFSCELLSGTVGWLSEDPLDDTDSPNVYGFVAMRPHEMTDPLGLQGDDEDTWIWFNALNRRINAERAAGASLLVPMPTALDQGSLWRAWNAWKQAPEKGRQAGGTLWRYEPTITPEQREVGAEYGAEAARRLSQTMGEITGAGFAVVLEVGEAIVEAEVGGRLVRVVVGAGGKVVRVIEDLGPASGPGKYVARREAMSAEAKAYQEAVANARPNQAYRVPYENPNPRGRPEVHFDGVTETGIPIDSKLSVVTRPKTVDQARRQAEVLRQQKTIGIWKVPSYSEALRARRIIGEAGASDTIRVVVEK